MFRGELVANLVVGLVLFPKVTQLDLTGPYEVFARMPATSVRVVAAATGPVTSERGLALSADTIFDAAPPLDVICVPGGLGVNAMMEDQPLLDFLQQRARDARLVTSVCTGALVLGAAGLLRGYRATTHWLSVDLLPLFGAIPEGDRVVIDRDRITAAGVTAGIDFGLTVAAHLFVHEVAQEIQLMLEYDPAPLFRSGSPRNSPPALVSRIRDARERVQVERRAIAERAAAKLRIGQGT